MICPGCGGVVGRDCFNVSECIQISQQMNNDQELDRIRENMPTTDHIETAFSEWFGGQDQNNSYEGWMKGIEWFKRKIGLL